MTFCKVVWLLGLLDYGSQAEAPLRHTFAVLFNLRQIVVDRCLRVLHEIERSLYFEGRYRGSV